MLRLGLGANAKLRVNLNHIWGYLEFSSSLKLPHTRLILINATCGVVCELLLALTFPELLLPNAMVAIANPLLSNMIFSDTAMYLYVDVMVTTLFVTILSNLLMFPYRYCQTANNWIYRNVFCNTKFFVLLVTVLLVLACGSSLPPLHGLYMDRDHIVEVMLNTRPSYYGFFKKHSVTGALVYLLFLC
ncbi:hypothetical protein Ddc_22637 [Ditylenchus destructor]|nr:hypothetical protein Ddc_22637 [Ditylenchus destructor]